MTRKFFFHMTSSEFFFFFFPHCWASIIVPIPLRSDFDLLHFVRVELFFFLIDFGRTEF